MEEWISGGFKTSKTDFKQSADSLENLWCHQISHWLVNYRYGIIYITFFRCSILGFYCFNCAWSDLPLLTYFYLPIIEMAELAVRGA